MHVVLHALNGVFWHIDGASAGSSLSFADAPLSIGSAETNSLRCNDWKGILDVHACITIDPDRVVMRCSSDSAKVTVNGSLVTKSVSLFDGDLLEIGNLQLTILCNREREVVASLPLPPIILLPTVSSDHVADLLMSEDEIEREKRRYDPALRKFRIDAIEPPAPEDTATQYQKARQRPPTRAPIKLPPPPPIEAATSVDAANTAIDRIIGPAKKKSKP